MKPDSNQSNAASTHYRLGFRGDLEGLRAVAILLVVAAHAKVSWLAGGFIGVDVFFVLSGYLITGLLVKEIEATHSLGFVDFYARRMRRLLPGMLLMIGMTCLLGSLLLLPEAQTGQASAAASAVFWLSNFHFAFQQMDYFSPGSESNLFLHTWSLGVEEQFYLIWPLLLVLAMGAWQPNGNPLVRRDPTWLMAGLLIGSFALALHWTYASPQLGFYTMPARAWEFALGSLVLLLTGAPNLPPRRLLRIRPSMQIVAGWVGLAVIIASALVFDNSFAYPGYWASLPSVGTALVLLAGSGQTRNAANPLLSLRPMQAIGRISYSWYLWHWPVLLLGAELIDFDSVLNRALLVLLSLMIAAASYRFFEKPIRARHGLVARPRLAVFASIALMLVAGFFALRWQTSAMLTMHDNARQPYMMARVDAPVIYGMGCDDWYHSSKVDICQFGNPDASHTAVAIGDSIGLQWFPAYARVFDRPDWKLRVMTKSSCPMVDAPIFYRRIGRRYVECEEWRNAVLQHIASMRPDIVILGSSHTYDFAQSDWEHGSRRIFDRLSSSARRIFVMRATPLLAFDGPSCVAPRGMLFHFLASESRCTSSAKSEQNENVYQWLGNAAEPFGNVSLMDLNDAVCPNGLCMSKLDGDFVFRDSQHLTERFARKLAPAVARKIGLDPGDAAATSVQIGPATTD